MTEPNSRPLHSASDLLEAGLTPQGNADELRAVAARYAVAITPAMVDLIDIADAADPIARQFVPHPSELRGSPEETADPIGDQRHSPLPGIVHRYPDRVLLKPLHACPVYCRFCFRREMVGPSGLGFLSPEELDAALDYVAAHSAIWEVVITGGDPLILSPRRLRAIMDRLATISHVKIVRLHSRVPVVSPDAVTDDLVASLCAGTQAVWVVLHANHARELTLEARAACARLVDAGVPMLSQSVLLRGVNDSTEALELLLRALVETRIKPYYLHHPDLAPGTGHFRLPITEGQALVKTLRGRISGLCQPTYVLDIPGGYGKAPLGPTAVTASPPNHEEVTCHVIEDWQGGLHSYPPLLKD